MPEPITVQRLISELEGLKREVDAGGLRSGEYDQRLARLIGELRERRIYADRNQLQGALDDAHNRGIITASAKLHIEKRLGLA